MPSPATRVLLVSASIGEGHDLPARVLAEALEARGVRAPIVDGLAEAGRVAEWLAGAATDYESRLGNLVFDAGHRVIADWAPTQRAMAGLITAVSRRGLLAAVERERPDVVVSTYPGSSEILGRLRLRDRLRVPVVSAITDLASLRYWAHRGIDLHLLTHPESAAEVRAVAGPGARLAAVHGLTDPAFRDPPSPGVARARLELPGDGRIVVVSGGGWAVGDLGGAVEEALAAGADAVVVLCGRREDLRARMAERFAHAPEVRAWGFTDRMADLLAAADVLVHSTAGLTVLEAMMSGCRTISFGWGLGHIRANNRAYERFGLAEVAATRPALGVALRAALQAPRPAPWQPDLPEAADLVLAQAAAAS
jgi:processive 1,2-diacylglycerol beta-glucosyltransferase